MRLFYVDVALLDLESVDEDESEAVALSLLELLFAETNAFYRQHCLAKQAVASTVALVVSSVFDAVACSQLQHEDAIEPSRFGAELCPAPEINDRHAARCLPQRSPEKVDTAAVVLPIQRTRLESRVAEVTRASLARKRPSPDSKLSTVIKPPSLAIPQTIAMPEVVDEEDPEDRMWRLKCLKELSGQSRTPAKLGSTSKWTTFARQIPVVEPCVSLEVDIIDNAPPALRQEVSSVASANAVKMKSSLTTFSSVSSGSTPLLRGVSAASSIASRQQVATLGSGSNRPSFAGSQSVPTLASSVPRKVRLNDSLSQQQGHPYHGVTSASSMEGDPWQFELHEWTPRTTVRDRFVPDMMVASAATIPATIALAPGVGFTHGDTKVKGPERREDDHTMSRKRFELHQRLTTDQLRHESTLLHSPGSPSSHAPVSGTCKSSLPTHSKQASPRPYETVPADPVPPPPLSPIAKNALVIPHNSASTPSLRVRHSSIRKRADVSALSPSHSDPLVTTEELDAIRKARPSSALGAVVVTTPRQSKGSTSSARPKTSLSKRDPASAYLREFPKPHAGTIKLNSRMASPLDPAAGDADSARQRLAWIS